jgi:hypothetical protein
MEIALIEKSEKGISRLSLYDKDLGIIESDMFSDLYSLNFHLQTLAKKCNIQDALLVVHDIDKNTVSLTLARDEHSFFIS